MKRNEEILNEYYQVKKSQSKKATYCMIPTIRHSGKGKTTETMKWLVGGGEAGREGRDEQGEHRGVLSAVKLPCIIL